MIDMKLCVIDCGEPGTAGGKDCSARRGKRERKK